MIWRKGSLLWTSHTVVQIITTAVSFCFLCLLFSFYDSGYVMCMSPALFYLANVFFFPSYLFHRRVCPESCLVDRSIICQAVCHYVVRCVSVILFSVQRFGKQCNIKNYTVSIKLHNYLLSVYIKKSYIFCEDVISLICCHYAPTIYNV